jgi:beta-galactosidase GanA
VVITPFLPAIDEGGFRERIREWVEGGGVWIVGPLSDIRTLDGTKFTHAPYGSLEDLGGIYCKYQIPGEPRDFAIKWNDGVESKGSIWYDGLELRGAETLAKYTEGPMKGLAAVAVNKLGKGSVITLGTMLAGTELVALIRQFAKHVGVSPAAEASDNLLVVPREGEAGKGVVIIEIENRPGTVFISENAVDILTGKEANGMVEVQPYGVMVLKY